MKQLLLAGALYGLAYYVFENVFNFIAYDLFDKKKTWKEKLRLKSSITASFWMIPVGSSIGLIMHLFFMIPFNYTNIFILLLVGIIGCVVITGHELGAGILLNIKLKLNLWHYDTKLNYKNQIDIFHSIGWFFITYLLLFIDKILF